MGLGALRAPKKFSKTTTLRWKIHLLRTKEKKTFLCFASFSDEKKKTALGTKRLMIIVHSRN